MESNYYVDIRVGKTNQNPSVLLDQARRLVDLQGKGGIVAKRGQTNARYDKKGRLSFPFSDRASAIRYRNSIEEYCSSAVQTRLRSTTD